MKHIHWCRDEDEDGKMIVTVMEDGVYCWVSVVGTDARSWLSFDREGIRLARARLSYITVEHKSSILRS